MLLLLLLLLLFWCCCFVNNGFINARFPLCCVNKISLFEPTFRYLTARPNFTRSTIISEIDICLTSLTQLMFTADNTVLHSTKLQNKLSDSYVYAIILQCTSTLETSIIYLRQKKGFICECYEIT